MKRIIGFFLFVISTASLIVSLAGVYEIWMIRQPLVDATTAGVNLFQKR